jgi:hypothetical protein
MVRLQVHIAMPFIIMQQETMPPDIIVQRFCIMVQAALSSQLQTIFIPPVHFSIFMVQRGIMRNCEPVGMFIGMVPVEAIAGMFMLVRSNIMLVMNQLLLRDRGVYPKLNPVILAKTAHLCKSQNAKIKQM